LPSSKDSKKTISDKDDSKFQHPKGSKEAKDVKDAKIDE